jgi:hypothetical protein
MTMRGFLRSPWFWVLAAAFVLRLAGLVWGLPASDGWDDDGFAPRNFLTALALTWKPGAFFTYPPLHAILLALLTWPGAVIALLRAHSLTQADVVGEITKPAYMTFFAVMARLVSITMSLGIIACAGQMARLIAGPRAGLCATIACALGVTLTYYGQVTNLDAPYLFWSMLSLLAWMHGIARRDPKEFRWGIGFAAAAIATKDQAYALFALSIPAIFIFWFVKDKWLRTNVRQVAVAILPAALIALVALLLLDGAITNPGGFAKRLAYLTGPASHDFATYTNDIAGHLALLTDMARFFTGGIAALASALFAIGAGFCVMRIRKIAALLPLFALVSFTLCFNLVALRSESRFLLPQAVLAAIYIGIAAEKLGSMPELWSRRAARAALAVIALFTLYRCLSVDAAMLGDPRYDAERWMAANITPGDTVEIYGQNAYLPRFPRGLISRIAETPLAIRNPLPGVTEIKQPFGAIENRRPRVIVVSTWWVQHYLTIEPASGGRTPSKIVARQYADSDARTYFTKLYAGGLPYRLVHQSRYDARLFPAIYIHESLDEGIDIFERVP